MQQQQLVVYPTNYPTSPHFRLLDQPRQGLYHAKNEITETSFFLPFVFVADDMIGRFIVYVLYERVNRTQVPKNSRGGILVCESEIKAAFDFFDVEGKGVITASTLRKRLGAFHRSLSARVRSMHAYYRPISSDVLIIFSFLYVLYEYMNSTLLLLVVVVAVVLMRSINSSSSVV